MNTDTAGCDDLTSIDTSTLSTVANPSSPATIVTTETSTLYSTLPPPSIEKSPDPYSTIRIADDIWCKRLQDIGCMKESLPKATYRQHKIPAYGPYETYYYDLSSIVIDFIKNINRDKNEGLGWNRFPKNMSDIKVKLIGILLELRITNSDNLYNLDQTGFIAKMETMWGADSTSASLEDNDKLRLIGLLFLERNSDKLYRLAQGVNSRNDIDDPGLSPRSIFQFLSLDFNNNDINSELPDEAVDIEGYDDFDANDMSRIRIQRDCKSLIF